jgi:ribosomal protein L11 methyltransferase
VSRSRPDRWLVLSAQVSREDPLRDLLSEGLLELGGLAVVDEGDALTIYLPPPEDLPVFLEHAQDFLADWLMDDAPPELTWRWQPNEDWEREWRRGLAPRLVGDRIVVKPSWTEWPSDPSQIVIEIDPEMAFGTGEHATTRGCLRLLETALRDSDRVLDVGSGSGILAIAAARLGAGEIIAVESDPDANINARDNIERNSVGDRVRLIEGTADASLMADLGEFDVIIANILSSVIRPLLPAFRSALAGTGGRLIVSGILREEHQAVVTDAESAGLSVVRTDEEEEWWSALLRRSDIRPNE